MSWGLSVRNTICQIALARERRGMIFLILSSTENSAIAFPFKRKFFSPAGCRRDITAPDTCQFKFPNVARRPSVFKDNFAETPSSDNGNNVA
jgi:hypothetical protein